MRRAARRVLSAALFGVAVVASSAQEPPPGPPTDRLPERAGEEAGELREEVRRYFHNRLRQELSLSDEQMERVVPELDAIQDARIAAGRERTHTMRELQRGLREGATDAELQELLDRFDSADDGRRQAERESLVEIDQGISVRQRVQLRFFVERFRRDMQRRVRELRGDRPQRRPPGEQPRRGGRQGER